METIKKEEFRHDDRVCTARLNAIGDALYAIGGKWKLRIVVVLKDRKRRFNELQRSIPGLSSKVLAAELRELELNGFVKRNVVPSTPVIIEYELTEYAATLDDVLESLSEWGINHREKIKAGMREASAASEGKL